MLNAVEHMNFFEGRATEYSKASTQGSWQTLLVKTENYLWFKGTTFL